MAQSSLDYPRSNHGKMTCSKIIVFVALLLQIFIQLTVCKPISCAEADVLYRMKDSANLKCACQNNEWICRKKGSNSAGVLNKKDLHSMGYWVDPNERDTGIGYAYAIRRFLRAITVSTSTNVH